MQRALTIAGSDSGAGAGVQADLKTFAAHGVYGMCALTAVTAQNTVGVTAYEAVSPGLVAAQIRAVVDDIGVDAAKTGMLPNAAVVEAVAAAAADLALPFLVVDPVMVAKSGDRLVDADAVAAMTRALLPKAFLVTPNVREAEVLAGIEVRGLDDLRDCARRILAFGARTVLLKGGHLDGDEIVDLLYDGRAFLEFRHSRVPGPHTHGTGCTFASAIAAHLARGRPLTQAVPLAQQYVAGAIRHAPGLGHGHGPMHHFWELDAPDRAQSLYWSP